MSKITLYSQTMVFTMTLAALLCVVFSLALNFVEVETVGEVYLLENWYSGKFWVAFCLSLSSIGATSAGLMIWT